MNTFKIILKNNNLMTRQEASDYLGMSTSTLSKLNCNQQYDDYLKPIKYCNKTFYKKESLDRFLTLKLGVDIS